jgi:threonine aldolase
VFYIGGTKVGALFGEAVVVTNEKLLHHFTPLIKQHGALLAKGRLLGVQFETLFTDDLYMKISQHAIDMAMKMKEAFLEKGYRMVVDSPTNQQFFYLLNDDLERLKKVATFELWGLKGETETPVRFVTSWATTESAIDQLIANL